MAKPGLERRSACLQRFLQAFDALSYQVLVLELAEHPGCAGGDVLDEIGMEILPQLAASRP